ncbi:hypothetical protein F383_29031 [Gossypium arboreum]|uniref:Uncharacterized protein n=1 Tax=Gossypium arboreum TaxID=29729 RepID=A0A0B0P7M6_GOSAR|nr:hypothetical protein F383_29031 [Gossypium arboreum]
MANSVTGRQVTAYTGNAAYFNLSFNIKKCPAQNDTSTDAIDTNSDVSPSNSFRGKSMPKSLSWYLDVNIDKNITTAVTEKQRAMRDEMAKTSNAGWFSKVGFPLSDFTPPGTVVDVANATVAINAATTEHDSEVLVSHSPPLSTSSPGMSQGLWSPSIAARCNALFPFSSTARKTLSFIIFFLSKSW